MHYQCTVISNLYSTNLKTMENLKKINVYAKDKSGMVHEFEYEHSNHSLERASQRGINNDMLSVALAY